MLQKDQVRRKRKRRHSYDRDRRSRSRSRGKKRRRNANDRYKQLENKWMGKRLDIYDNSTKEWWPSTVVDLTDYSVKIRYDGYSMKYDEWIKIGSHRIAAIHQHTKNHQHHRKLTIESEQRKKEWNATNIKSTNFNLPSSSNNNTCQYYNKCGEILQQFLKISNIIPTMFEPNGNRCFCSDCHHKRGDKEIYSRGEPPQTYILPIDYARFGIKLSSKQIDKNILGDWHVVYHGTKSNYLKDIIESGLILLKPTDFKINNNAPKYERNEIQRYHIQHKFKRINKFTNKREVFDPSQIFTSPSCIYSSKYCDITDINGYKISFMFQCRQKPGTYSRGQETMGFDEENIKIDKWIRNNSIEYYTKHNLNIIITGLLIKIHNFEEQQEEEERLKKEREVMILKRLKMMVKRLKKELAESKDSDDEESEDREDSDENDENEESEDSDDEESEDSDENDDDVESEYSDDNDDEDTEKSDCISSDDGVECWRCNGNGKCFKCQGNGYCNKCNGSGIVKGTCFTCKTCKGTGARGCTECIDIGIIKGTCFKCDGTGILY